jgi:hypothetical protein
MDETEFQLAFVGSHAHAEFCDEFTAQEVPFQTKFLSQEVLATISAPSGEEIPSLHAKDWR